MSVSIDAPNNSVVVTLMTLANAVGLTVAAAATCAATLAVINAAVTAQENGQ